MGYLIKNSFFLYFIDYFNDELGFRNSKILTLNKSSLIEIDNYLKSGKKTEFIENIIKKGFKFNNLKIIGDDNKINPLHMQIELTDNCNLNCSYCYRNASHLSKKINDINKKDLFNNLERYRQKNLLEIGITGGEPTLHKEFISIMKFVLDKFEMVELTTNATNPDIVLKLLKELKEKDLAKLNISISFHDWDKNYEKFLKGKHYLNNFLNKMKEIKPIRMILTDFDYDKKKADEAEKTLLSLGVGFVDFSFISPIGRAKGKIDEEKYLKRYPKSDKGRNPNLNQLNCSLVFKHTIVDPEGNLRPCALFPPNFKIGKMNNNFIDKKYYFLYELDPPSKDICGDCNFLDYCIGCIFKGLFNSKKECIYKKKIRKEYGVINDLLAK